MFRGNRCIRQLYLSAAPSPFRVTKAYCLSREQVLISPYGEKSLLSSSCVASIGRFPTNSFTFSPLISESGASARGALPLRRISASFLIIHTQNSIWLEHTWEDRNSANVVTSLSCVFVHSKNFRTPEFSTFTEPAFVAYY